MQAASSMREARKESRTRIQEKRQMLGCVGGSKELLRRGRTCSPKGVHSRAALRVRGTSRQALTKEARPQNGSKKTRAAIERMDKERMDNDAEGITLVGRGNSCPMLSVAILRLDFAWTSGPIVKFLTT